ncbi:MAG: TVP38/TMEM64 family protein [Candidatus Aureabacteria bacterium]|nr:TVP38/TMEM64 family protein [Candidatus Auribacterota bacterium]
MKNIKLSIIKLIIGAAVVGIIWYFLKCRCIDFKLFTPASIRDYIQSFGRIAALAYIIAYALNTISIFPPIAPLSLTAGLAFGPLLGAVYLMLGAVIGTTAAFMISRFFGRSLVERFLKGRFKNLDEKLEKHGFMTVLFFRIVPLVPYEVLNYISGLSKIKFRDYFFATFLGLIPGVVIAAFFGGSLGEIRVFEDIFTPKILVAFGLMILILAVPAVYKLIKKRKDRR